MTQNLIIKTQGIHRPPEDVNIAGHSSIGPSSAHIWGPSEGCQGYSMMRAQCSERGGRSEADEGVLAHALAADILADIAGGRLRDPGVRRDRIGKDGITEEIFNAASIYITNVRDVIYKAHVFGGKNLGVEQTILCEWIHPHCFGTPDAWVFDHHNQILYLWDFKFGFGLVDVFENWQLIAYAAGVLQWIGLIPDNDVLTVEFRIVQPRGFHRDGPIRTWLTTLGHLQSFWKTLRVSACETLSGKAETQPGSHCRYCEARHACVSAQRIAMDTVDYLSQPIGHELTPDAIAKELVTLRRARKSIEYRLTGLEEQAKSLIRSGVSLSGFRVENSVGNLEWSKPVETILAVGTAAGVDLAKLTTMTPTQAIAAGVDEKLIKSLSKRQKRGIKIVEDDCKAARKVFGK